MSREDRLRADLDQLQAALRDRDGDAAEETLKRMYDADPETTNRLMDQLIVEGIKRMTR